MTDAPATPAPPRGPAVYFDGTSSARNGVVVELGAKALRILACRSSGPDRLLDEWPYAELRRMSAPDDVLRLGRHGETLLARLEIRAPELAAAVED
ncbi:MAG: metalloendopeptidase, partial [Xanthobacteraceae bacterium]